MMKKILLFSLIALLSLLPTTNAIANSAPPPSVVWFTLVFETQPTPRLMGIQLIGCPTDQCTQPVLFQQYGRCDAPGCLSSPVTLSGFATSFGCAANQCRLTSFNAYGGMDFKLVAQFSDQVRSSPVTGKLPSGFGEVAAWNVIVGASDLSVTPDATIPTISEPYELFRQDLAVIGLSILVELVAAGAVFLYLGTHRLAPMAEKVIGCIPGKPGHASSRVAVLSHFWAVSISRQPLFGYHRHHRFSILCGFADRYLSVATKSSPAGLSPYCWWQAW